MRQDSSYTDRTVIAHRETVPVPALLLLAVALALPAAALRQKALQLHPPPVETQLDVPRFPAEVSGPFSFGMRSVVADVCFMEAIQAYGSYRTGVSLAEGAPLDRQLARLLEYATELDPGFAGAYWFAGYAMPRTTLEGITTNVLPAEQILQRGVRERPDDWRIAFILGYIQAFFLDEPEEASANLRHAASSPRAPHYLPFLANRLAVEGGELETAEQMAETMEQEATEEATRAAWHARLLDLQMERGIRAIEAAVRQFRARTGRDPSSLIDLLRAGELRNLRPEPHGGRYVLEHGAVRSTAGERPRLRHHEKVVIK
jgi:hypothetical protein